MLLLSAPRLHWYGAITRLRFSGGGRPRRQGHQRVLKECCFVKYGEHTSKDDARLIYDAWCKAQGVEPMKPGPLTTELKELTGGRVRPTKCRNGSTQYHAYKNLVITPEARQTYGLHA